MRLSLAFLAFALAAPAAAQIVGHHRYDPVPPSNPFLEDSRLPGPGVGRDLRDIHRKVERARGSGLVSRSEARQLKREERAIGRLAERYGRDGLSPSERAELEIRARILRDNVNRAH
ncbi:MAG: hypothetical protein ACJ8ER_00750 [Allosphingosinicella sp.]